MASLSSIAVSGLQAAQLRLQSSARNVANLPTAVFHRQEVRLQALPDGAGVTAQVQRADRPGPALEVDAIEQLAARNAFVASAAVFRTADRLAGTLLDLRA